jgi:hypothetical protein
MGNTMHTLIRAAALALTFQQAASLTATLAPQGAGGAAIWSPRRRSKPLPASTTDQGRTSTSCTRGLAARPLAYGAARA